MTTVVISNYHILVDGKYYTTLDYKAYSKDDTIGICHHTNKDDTLIKGRVAPAEISLNGTIYATAEAFVDAFNAITIAALSYLLTSMKANTDYPDNIISQRIAVPAIGAVHVANVNGAGYLTLTADEDNTGDIYVGGADVSINSYHIEPGKSLPLEHVNLSEWYALAEAAEDVLYVAGSYK